MSDLLSRGKQLAPLLAPIGWHICHQRIERHLGRLSAFENRSDNVGSQKGYLHDPPHISIA
jgi:hypothetical protein